MKRSDFFFSLGLGGVFSLLENRQTALSPNRIIKPARLKKGDTIGLISPASIIPERERYEEIEETMRKLGFKVKVGRHALEQRGYFAGTDRQRAEDFNSMFRDPEVDAVIPFRGGWGSNRILPYIDFEAIAGNPKPLIGFSDITSLLLSIYAKTGLVTFHGPVGKSDWTEFTFRHFKRAVMRKSTLALRNPEHEMPQTLRPGMASGPLLGGNLTVLASMLGTDYLPNFDGAILFLEDIGEDVYRIDRLLTQLKMGGILDKVNGIYFGKCTDCLPGNDYSLTLDEVMRDHFLPLDVPVCTGAMIGHIRDMFTLPVGLRGTLNAKNGTLTFSEPAVI
ncbi:MAG: LD-carboxypeptidase [Balneolaceae bacterium]|nr:LD-carboxypeptidase [Balneolaceae bacterium]